MIGFFTSLLTLSNPKLPVLSVRHNNPSTVSVCNAYRLDIIPISRLPSHTLYSVLIQFIRPINDDEF